MIQVARVTVSAKEIDKQETEEGNGAIGNRSCFDFDFCFNISLGFSQLYRPRLMANILATQENMQKNNKTYRYQKAS